MDNLIPDTPINAYIAGMAAGEKLTLNKILAIFSRNLEEIHEIEGTGYRWAQAEAAQATIDSVQEMAMEASKH